MSKILYACSRQSNFTAGTKDRLNDICNQLVPDNIGSPKPHVVRVKNDLAYAVCMNSGALKESEMSVLLGFIYEQGTVFWDKPRACCPNGNYALFRAGENEVEVVSDCVGTRTVWYYKDDDIFVASTSQRALVMFIESFEFDERVIPWMLSTGSLGPQFSWDKRFNRLPVDSFLRLDRSTWSLSVTQAPIEYSMVERREEDHEKLLVDAIRQTVSSLSVIDFDRWLLPLSGGYDSRGILCFINNTIGVPSNLKTITWGLNESLEEKGNDAFIAKELAVSVGVEHKYYKTNISSEPLEFIFDRFLFCSEGRIDHISGYMDGMNIWKQLHDEGVDGIIRGDEGLGELPSSSELTVRNMAGCGLCSDYKNLESFIGDFGLPPQEMPMELRQRQGEALYEWRDRLHQEYRIPTVLASLSDIKYSYLEQINPLLSRPVLNAVRSFSGHLRTDKYMFKKIVESVSPDVPFADKVANATPRDILRKKECVDLVKKEVGSSYAINLLGDEFVEKIISGIKVGRDEPKRKSMKGLVKSFLPLSIKNRLRDTVVRPTVDENVLAFRVFMIVKMHKMLSVDAGRVSGVEHHATNEAPTAAS